MVGFLRFSATPATSACREDPSPMRAELRGYTLTQIRVSSGLPVDRLENLARTPRLARTNSELSSERFVTIISVTSSGLGEACDSRGGLG